MIEKSEIYQYTTKENAAIVYAIINLTEVIQNVADEFKRIADVLEEADDEK